MPQYRAYKLKKLIISKQNFLYVLLIPGLVAIGVGIWLLLSGPDEESQVSAHLNPVLNFQEDFAFRGKPVSLEEAGNLIGARVPVPACLPDDYAVREIYISAGSQALILLMSPAPIEKITREPPDGPKDYPINLVKCRMCLHIYPVSDAGEVGENINPPLGEMVFDESAEQHVIIWSRQIEQKIVYLQLIVEKDVTDKEEVIRIAESVQ